MNVEVFFLHIVQNKEHIAGSFLALVAGWVQSSSIQHLGFRQVRDPFGFYLSMWCRPDWRNKQLSIQWHYPTLSELDDFNESFEYILWVREVFNLSAWSSNKMLRKRIVSKETTGKEYCKTACTHYGMDDHGPVAIAIYRKTLHSVVMLHSVL